MSSCLWAPSPMLKHNHFWLLCISQTGVWTNCLNLRFGCSYAKIFLQAILRIVDNQTTCSEGSASASQLQLKTIGVWIVFNWYLRVWKCNHCHHCQTTLPSLPSGRFLFILPPSLNEVISIPLSLKSPHCVFWSGIKQEINTTARMLLHAAKDKPRLSISMERFKLCVFLQGCHSQVVTCS